MFLIFEMAIEGLCISVVTLWGYNKQPYNDMVMSWVAIYGCIYWVYILRRLICILQWCCMKDPRIIQAKIKFYIFTIFTSMEIIWFGFGNFIFYNRMLNDKSDNDYDLWYLMLVIVIFGYIMFVFYLCSWIIICGTLCLLR